MIFTLEKAAENVYHISNVNSMTAFRRLLPRISLGERKFFIIRGISAWNKVHTDQIRTKEGLI